MWQAREENARAEFSSNECPRLESLSLSEKQNTWENFSFRCCWQWIMWIVHYFQRSFCVCVFPLWCRNKKKNRVCKFTSALKIFHVLIKSVSSFIWEDKRTKHAIIIIGSCAKPWEKFSWIWKWKLSPLLLCSFDGVFKVFAFIVVRCFAVSLLRRFFFCSSSREFKMQKKKQKEQCTVEESHHLLSSSSPLAHHLCTSHTPTTIGKWSGFDRLSWFCWMILAGAGTAQKI